MDSSGTTSRGGRDRAGSARVESVLPDQIAARSRLQHGGRHLASAELSGIDADSAYLLAYQAGLKALDATLSSAGFRVSERGGAHVLRLREARRLLGHRHADAIDRLDRTRRTRHRVAYEFEEVGDAALRDAIQTARALLEAAGAFVDGQVGD